ncbi:MerR family transcriptional regulator [Dietzia sp. NPDC055340]
MLIGEVARRSGVSARMLRHYDSLGLVSPSGRTSGGHREYSGADLRRLLHVESLRSLGLTLRQVGAILDRSGFDPQSLIASLITRTEARIAAERELLATLRHVADAEPREWDDVLRAIEILSDLASPDVALRQRTALIDPAANGVAPDALTEAALRESVPNVAGALRWALHRAGGADPGTLEPALASGDPVVRRRAVELLREAESSSARTTLLISTLDDGDSGARATAAIALGEAGSVVAAPTLIRMVVDGVRDVEASDALAVLSLDEGSAARIIDALVGELAVEGHQAATRIRLLQALVELRHPTATSLLAEAARDPDAEVARVAAAFLAMRTGPGGGGGRIRDDEARR